MAKSSKSGLIRAFINRTKADSVFFVPGAHSGSYSINDLLYRQAELALAGGDTRRAFAIFSVYLKKAKALPGCLFQVFTAAAVTGKFPLAFGALEKLEGGGLTTVQKIELANPWYRIHDKALLGRLLAALERYRPSAGTSPRPAYLFILKSACGIDDAAALARLMAGFNAENREAFRRRIWLYFKIAETALNLRHFAEAEKIFSRILREEPDNEQAAGRLAETLLCAAKSAAAFAALGKAAKYHKVSMGVWEGELLLWLGRYAEAAKKLKAGAAAGHPLAWCWLGAALFKLGIKEEAVAALKNALVVRPDDNEARIWLSEALAACGKAKEARAHLEAALKANPSDFWAWLNLTALCLPGGEIGKILEVFKLPREVTVRLAIKAGLPPEGSYSVPEIKLIIDKARELAKGVRRDEDYLRELWLG
ncbi:MAG: tetratricopeptide repeat protein [Elusimicrobiota bacterium]|nr:tetratricopeptide repeat protein [Elusimicrobiota bacterium]